MIIFAIKISENNHNKRLNDYNETIMTERRALVIMLLAALHIPKAKFVRLVFGNGNVIKKVVLRYR